MPNFAPIAANVIPSLRAVRIADAASGDSFLARLGLDVALNLPPALACSWLPLRLVHSRFVAALLALSKSEWLTSGRSLGGRKCAATMRCTLTLTATPPVQRVTNRYPSLSLRGLSTFPRLTAIPPQRCPTSWSRLRIRPKSLTSYLPSVPVIGFQVSCICAFKVDALHYTIQSSVHCPRLARQFAIAGVTKAKAVGQLHGIYYITKTIAWQDILNHG